MSPSGARTRAAATETATQELASAAEDIARYEEAAEKLLLVAERESSLRREFFQHPQPIEQEWGGKCVLGSSSVRSLP